VCDRRCFAFLAGGTSINPKQVLDDIFNGKLGYFAISDIQDREGYVTSAITRIETSRFVDIGNRAQQLQAATVAIRINGSAGNFVNGTLSERRTTILHELAHAIWDLYGPTTGNGMLSADYGIQPDFDSNESVAAAKSEANHDAIKEHCR
jgi:hypothetical protein